MADMTYSTEVDETRPLVAAHPRRIDSNRLLAPLLCICVLERWTHYQCMADLATVKRVENSTSVAWCGILGDNSSMESLSNTWPGQSLRSAAFLLPVVGGALADNLFGCVSLLRLASGIYILGAGLLSLAVYCAPVCAWWAHFICGAALSVASGFARPCLLSLIYDAGLARFSPMVLCQLSYLCEALGQVIGSSVACIADWQQVPLTGITMAPTGLMLALTLFAGVPERRGWRPNQFQLALSWPRMQRLMKVSLPVILMSSVTVLGSFALNGWEVTIHGERLAGLTSTQRDLLTNTDLVLLIYSAELFVCLLLLALLTREAPVVLAPQTPRIAAGLVLACAGQFSAALLDFCLCRATLQPRDWRVLIFLMFGGVNILNAAAEAVTFTTMNEVALLIAPRQSRTHVIGLFTALWGSGFMFSVLVQWASYTASRDVQEDYFMNTLPKVYLSLGCVMLAAILYFAALVPEALSWLIGIEAKARRREAAEVSQDAARHLESWPGQSRGSGQLNASSSTLG